MFTGIIETLGILAQVEEDKSNRVFTVTSDLADQLKVDQSLSHNGVCLTVVDLGPNWHRVVAVPETLDRSNLGRLQVGDRVNLERAMIYGGRLDGHLVQGHVDGMAHCLEVTEIDGSHVFTFRYDTESQHLLVDKGSIAIDGVSLTLINPTDSTFSIAIIPYTWEHTTFGTLKAGDQVNLEYDILGKYVARQFEIRQ